MISNLLWILNYIRENLLEKFMLPELDMSYWDFLLILAVVGIVITVLVNSVQIGASYKSSASKEEKYQEVLRSRERVKASERDKIKNEKSSAGASYDLDAYERYMSSK